MSPTENVQNLNDYIVIYYHYNWPLIIKYVIIVLYYYLLQLYYTRILQIHEISCIGNLLYLIWMYKSKKKIKIQ